MATDNRAHRLWRPASRPISGHWSKAREGDGDFRSINRRFRGKKPGQNLHLVKKLRQEAHAKGVTVAQLAIPWVLARGKNIVPLVGARKRDRLDESLGALDVELAPQRWSRSCVPSRRSRARRQ
jgi:aryl-alcohol dehydrogenase-like predicted oxidoreductase